MMLRGSVSAQHRWRLWWTVILLLALSAAPARAQTDPWTPAADADDLSMAAAEESAPLSQAAAGSGRIGLQVGHWRTHELPDELARLRTATGGSGGGVREVDLNLTVAQRTAEQLRARGYTVDVLPATVPPAYQADVFLAIHADAVTSPGPRGFKLARARASALPATDDRLVAIMREEYGRATGLPWSPAITRNMTGYYAFGSTRLRHAIHPTTPAAILEMGYVTNPADRALMTGQTERVVQGIVRGLVRFVDSLPPPEQRERPVAAPVADCRRFAETGQEVCGPFKRGWEAGGGLIRFGLPISAEIQEGNPVTGKERTVQYFERARFEYHPEAAGDEIQLGLLGRVVAAGREAERPFRPMQRFPDRANARYFPETSHSLAGGFKLYWEDNGGLDVFGLPISEEFEEVNPADGNTYIVQYFERARFEYHPEHQGTPYETQLGHLGRQVYRQLGRPAQ